MRSRCLRLPAPVPRRTPPAPGSQGRGARDTDRAAGAGRRRAAGGPRALRDRSRSAAPGSTALGKPRPLSPVALAARIEAGGQGRAQGAAWRWSIDWLAAWVADLARVAAGGTAARNPDSCRAPWRRWRPRWRPWRSFAIIGRCWSSARSWRTRCSPASWPRSLLIRLPRTVSLTMADQQSRRLPVPPPWRGPACCRSTSARRPRSTPRTCRSSRAAASSFRPRAQYALGEEVFMLLSLMDDPNRLAVQGKVVWITPEGVQGNRTQGIGVQFTQDETGAAARATIEKLGALVRRPHEHGRSRRRRQRTRIVHRAVWPASMFVDSHCHLDFPGARRRDFRRSSTAMREHAVTHALCIAVDAPDWPRVLALAQAHPHLYATRRRASGLPRHRPSPRSSELRRARRRSRRWWRSARPGSTTTASRATSTWQRERFRPHIRAARECAQAAGDPHARVRRTTRSRSCARSARARRRRDALLHRDLGGRARRRSTSASTSRSPASSRSRMRWQLKDVAQRVPLDRMLIETDSPYLAPVPYRGKRNQPAFVRYVAEEIARLRDITVEASAPRPPTTSSACFGIDRNLHAASVTAARVLAALPRRVTLASQRPSPRADAALRRLRHRRRKTIASARCARSWPAAWTRTRSAPNGEPVLVVGGARGVCAASSMRCWPRRANVDRTQRRTATPRSWRRRCHGHLEIVEEAARARARRSTAGLDAADLRRHGRQRRRGAATCSRRARRSTRCRPTGPRR